MSPINIVSILGAGVISIMLIREYLHSQKDRAKEKIRREILRSLHRRDYLI